MSQHAAQERRQREQRAVQLQAAALLREQRASLAAAFAGWSEAVACLGAARQLLRRVLLRALQRAFRAWRWASPAPSMGLAPLRALV